MEQIQLEDTCARAKTLGGKIAIANVGFFFFFFFLTESVVGLAVNSPLSLTCIVCVFMASLSV